VLSHVLARESGVIDEYNLDGCCSE